MVASIAEDPKSEAMRNCMPLKKPGRPFPRFRILCRLFPARLSLMPGVLLIVGAILRGLGCRLPSISFVF